MQEGHLLLVAVELCKEVGVVQGNGHLSREETYQLHIRGCKDPRLIGRHGEDTQECVPPAYRHPHDRPNGLDGKGGQSSFPLTVVLHEDGLIVCPDSAHHPLPLMYGESEQWPGVIPTAGDEFHHFFLWAVEIEASTLPPHQLHGAIEDQGKQAVQVQLGSDLQVGLAQGLQVAGVTSQGFLSLAMGRGLTDDAGGNPDEVPGFGTKTLWYHVVDTQQTPGLVRFANDGADGAADTVLRQEMRGAEAGLGPEVLHHHRLLLLERAHKERGLGVIEGDDGGCILLPPHTGDLPHQAFAFLVAQDMAVGGPQSPGDERHGLLEERREIPLTQPLQAQAGQRGLGFECPLELNLRRYILQGPLVADDPSSFIGDGQGMLAGPDVGAIAAA